MTGLTERSRMFWKGGARNLDAEQTETAVERTKTVKARYDSQYDSQGLTERSRMFWKSGARNLDAQEAETAMARDARGLRLEPESRLLCIQRLTLQVARGKWRGIALWRSVLNSQQAFADEF